MDLGASPRLRDTVALRQDNDRMDYLARTYIPFLPSW